MITGKELIKQITAERDAALAQVERINSHMIKMQNFCAQYITPRGGIGDAEFINKIIYFLDGPEQRLAQSTPAKCLAEIKAKAIEDAAQSLKNLPSTFHTGKKEFDNGIEISAEFLLSKANQLRQQAKDKK